MTVRLSVVMPAYNEAAGIEAAVLEVADTVLRGPRPAELVVVNDGSRDDTGAILDRLGSTNPAIRVIHRPNGGHGPALRTGIDAARGELLLLVDSDRQIPIRELAKLEAAIDSGADAAFGVRVVRHDPALRLWLTKLIRGTVGMLFGVRLTDANVPFKLFHRRLWEAAAPSIPPDTLAPSLLFAIYVARARFRVIEIPVEHLERNTGVVSIRRWRLLKFCWRAFRQLLAFRRRLPRG